jgi:hypothetical protein
MRSLAMEPRELEEHVYEMLGQADGFVRAGDFTGAYARARYAADQLEDFVRACPGSIELRHLRDDVVTEADRYERLLRDWQRSAAARYSEYLSREA